MRRRAARILLALAAVGATAAAGERPAPLAEVREILETGAGPETNARAAAAISRALDLEPRGEAFEVAMLLRRRILEELDYSTGSSFLVALRERYPHDERIYRGDLARLAAAAGRPAEAARQYEWLAARFPEKADYALGLAVARDRLGDAGGAIAACEAAADRTRSARAYRHLGILRWRHGRGPDTVEAAFANAAAAARRLPEGERRGFLRELERERDAHRRAVARRRAVAEHLDRLDVTLTLVGGGWLLLLAAGALVLRRLGRRGGSEAP